MHLCPAYTRCACSARPAAGHRVAAPPALVTAPSQQPAPPIGSSCRAAEEVLAAADARFPHSQSKALRACRLAIAHDRALHRRELRQAEEIAAQLAGLASPTDNTDVEIRWESGGSELGALPPLSLS